MPTLSPLLTTTPAPVPTYSAQIAETFSWIPITSDVRPLYAKATYDISTNALSQNGATLFTDTTQRAGSWTRLDVLAQAAVSLTSTNWDGNATAGVMSNVTVNTGVTLYGNFTAIKLGSGTVLAYKA